MVSAEAPSQSQFGILRVASSLCGTTKQANIVVMIKTMAVRTARPRSAEIPLNPCFAMTEVTPAKIIDRNAFKTQIFISLPRATTRQNIMTISTYRLLDLRDVSAE